LPREPSAEQAARVDALVADLRTARDSATGLDATVRTSYDRALGELDSLATVRTRADSTSYPASDVVTGYGRVIAALVDLTGDLTHATDDEAISQRADAVFAIGTATEHVAVQNSVLRVAALGNVVPPRELTLLRAADAEATEALADFDRSASARVRESYDQTVSGPDVRERLRLLERAESRGERAEPVDIDPNQLDVAATATLDKYR